MASIEEVGPGDYVKTGPGRFKEIAVVEKNYHAGSGHLKSWTVITTDGARVSMFDALAYRKKGDMPK